jgi:hypothetical protein
MRIVLVALFGLMVSLTAFGDDYNRIIRLEQDVRDLERQLGTVERELRELRQQGRGSTLDAAATRDESLAPSDKWLSAANWKRIRVGMTELEVIETLGRPTSMRAEGNSRVLFYAMEIGSAGFLGGSVTLEDQKVSALETPVLK